MKLYWALLQINFLSISCFCNISAIFMFSYIINCVFHLLYQVLYGINICKICNTGGVYDILYRNIFSSEQNLAHIVLSFIDQTTDSCIIQL